MVSAAAITMLKAFEIHKPAASFTCTVILYNPALLEGVPDIAPELAPKPSPAGHDREPIDQT